MMGYSHSVEDFVLVPMKTPKTQPMMANTEESMLNIKARRNDMPDLSNTAKSPIRVGMGEERPWAIICVMDFKGDGRDQPAARHPACPNDTREGEASICSVSVWEIKV